MKTLIVLSMLVCLAMAGRGKKKTWYGPVTSEAECAASTRSAAVTFKTEDIATALCRDVIILFIVGNIMDKFLF